MHGNHLPKVQRQSHYSIVGLKVSYPAACPARGAGRAFGVWARHSAPHATHNGPLFCVPSTEIHHRYTQLLTAMAEIDFNKFVSPPVGCDPAPNLMYICTSQGEPCLSLTQCDNKQRSDSEQIRQFRINFINGHVTRCSTGQ